MHPCTEDTRFPSVVLLFLIEFPTLTSENEFPGWFQKPRVLAWCTQKDTMGTGSATHREWSAARVPSSTSTLRLQRDGFHAPGKHHVPGDIPWREVTEQPQAVLIATVETDHGRYILPPTERRMYRSRAPTGVHTCAYSLHRPRIWC